MTMAAIRIQTEEVFIPVEIGEVELKFMVDDESLNRLDGATEIFEKKGKEIDEKVKAGKLSKEKEFEATKGFVKESYDYLLGEGAFDAVYEQTPALQSVVKYFIDIGEGLSEELKARGIDSKQSEKMKKYIGDNKEKKNKNK